MLVGSFYKSSDLYVSWGQYMKSQYDLSDAATKFYYDSFELMYKTFSQTVDENKVNVFMSQDKDRLATYKKFGGYKVITQWTHLADIEDFKNYFHIVKKYSLIREYERNGYPVQKILQHRKFNEWTANDIYKIIRAKADKINTVILANEDGVVLNDKTKEAIKTYLHLPQMGLEIPWSNLNEMFRGCRLGKVVFNGFLSNEGKTRNLIMLAAYISLIKNEKFLLLSNEMDEEDLRSALITTVVNNKEFKEIHKVDILKPEKEIVLGMYRDVRGDFLQRKLNNDGSFAELKEEFEERVEKESPEYKKIIEIGRWIDSKRDRQLFFEDVGNDYSDETLEFKYKKYNIVHGVRYAGYDTLKGFGTDDWQTVKQTGTKLKEFMKQSKMFLWAVFQLTDDSVFTDIFQFSSNNIANAKQIKHIADCMIMGKQLQKEEYGKYRYISNTSSPDWGEPEKLHLDCKKKYFALKCEKNRGGDKSTLPLMEYDLNYNTWVNVGSLIKAT